jgi:PAT family acetyl-CoA transporter-like MFS transporter 1
MVTNSSTSKWSICVTLVLYILQGMNLGLTNSIPLFLIYYGATWKDRGTFNFAAYPFSLKLLWAPLIDVLYITRFGRRKSWLIPIQLITAGMFLLLSFYVQSLIVKKNVILLTIIFFVIILLTATEDICIDGLAITLFAVTNPQWASTSQTVGQTFGRFLGSSFLLTFESANFTNKFIRKPLSLPLQQSGLFSLEQFIRFVAVTFLIVTILLLLFVRENEQISKNNNGQQLNEFSLKKTYLSIFKLLKKKCIRQLTLISLLSPIGHVAVSYMTQLSLLRFVSKCKKRNLKE